MDKIQKISTALGNIGEAIDLISGLCKAAIGGPMGIAIYLAMKILTGELDITQIPKKVKEIIEGIKALKELIQDNADLIKDMLPAWMVGVIEFFQNPPSLNDVLNKVVEFVEEKINGLSAPLPRLLHPLIDFVRGQADKIGEIAKLITSGNGSDIVKGIFKILAIGFTSAVDLIKTVKSMWNIFCDILSECCASGDIYVKYKKKAFGIRKYFWQFQIPGLCSFSGEGYILDMVAAKLLLGLLGNLGLSEKEI